MYKAAECLYFVSAAASRAVGFVSLFSGYREVSSVYFNLVCLWNLSDLTTLSVAEIIWCYWQMNDHGASVQWYWRVKPNYWDKNLSHCHFVCDQSDMDWPLIRYYGPAISGHRGAFQNIAFSFNLCVLLFQTATNLSGHTVINLFGPTYLVKGNVRYLFWPRGAVK
jgi:hypothetical protein